MPSRIELHGDLIYIAQEELGAPAERLLQTIPVLATESILNEPMAEFEGADPYPDRTEEAALYGAWIICRRPFPKRNRQIGYRFMRLMLKRAEVPWPRAQEDSYEIAQMLRRLEEEEISVGKFVEWVCLRVATA